jgi:diaminohydroxyphosphoribosylaminopyrimidine deaminase/5-amino-6-(5-phosphoribosylamino)uracil reductase
VYIAPRLLGSDGKALLELSGIQSLADSVDFLVEDLTKVGGDIKVTLVPAVSADR